MGAERDGSVLGGGAGGAAAAPQVPPLGSLLGSVIGGLQKPKQGENGPPASGVSLLGEPPKDFKIPLNPYLNLQSLLPPSSLGGAANKAFALKAGVLGSVPTARRSPSSLADPLLPSPGLAAEGYAFDYQPDLGSRIFPQSREHAGPLLGSFGHGRHKLSSTASPGFERGALGGPPLPPFYSGSPSSYFTSGLQAGLKQSHLGKPVGMPPGGSSDGVLPAPPSHSSHAKTPAQKRASSHLLPSPEPSPEGCYVGQHSQGLGGHYADSYLKRKRIF